MELRSSLTVEGDMLLFYSRQHNRPVRLHALTDRPMTLTYRESYSKAPFSNPSRGTLLSYSDLSAHHRMKSNRFFSRETVGRNSMATMEARKVIVYGGKGALGTACVHHFRAKNWVSICFRFNPTQTKYRAHVLGNIT